MTNKMIFNPQKTIAAGSKGKTMATSAMGMTPQPIVEPPAKSR